MQRCADLGFYSTPPAQTVCDQDDVYTIIEEGPPTTEYDVSYITISTVVTVRFGYAYPSPLPLYRCFFFDCPLTLTSAGPSTRLKRIGMPPLPAGMEWLVWRLRSVSRKVLAKFPSSLT